jgi:hypothetical protein
MGIADLGETPAFISGIEDVPVAKGVPSEQDQLH